MQKITYTNERGQSIKLTNTKPFFLRAIEGTGAVGTDVQMQKAPFQDGASYIDTLLEPRYLTLEVVILSENQTELYQYRQQLSEIFNPKFKGTIKYINNNTEKILPVVVEKAPVWGKTRLNVQPCIISLVAPSPFWLDTFEESYEMAAWIGGLSFPLELPMTFEEAGDQVTISNEGNADTPVIIEFNGPATNPRIDNLTTTKYIRVKRDLLEGEKLVITTKFGNKSVTKVATDGRESNAFHYIDLNSEFWQLQPGDNQIKYSADAGAEQATVLVRWKNRYIGV